VWTCSIVTSSLWVVLKKVDSVPENSLVFTTQADKNNEDMRGQDEQQLGVFSYVSPEQRIPPEHPLRQLRVMADEALRELKPRFSKLYAKTGRPSIAPEKLLRACCSKCCTPCAANAESRLRCRACLSTAAKKASAMSPASRRSRFFVNTVTSQIGSFPEPHKPTEQQAVVELFQQHPKHLMWMEPCWRHGSDRRAFAASTMTSSRPPL
jgi:hypothetical protein